MAKKKKAPKTCIFQISVLLQGKLTSYSAGIYTQKICIEAIYNDNINYNIYKTSFHGTLK